MADGLAQSFISAAEAPRISAPEELEGGLAAAIEEAHRAWPGLEIGGPDFAAYLGARAPEGDEPLASLRVVDLYLACGCVLGAAGAVEIFDSVFGPDIAAVTRRFPRLPSDDVAQQVRAKILVGSDGPPKLADYSGLGFLQNWVRITAVRTCLDLMRKLKGNREIADTEGLMAVADPDEDVELAYLKRHYRGEFKRSFTEAIASLSSSQRNALRQHLIAGLTIDQIAKVYGIHRATAARRVARAREALLSATRRSLAARLQIDRDELASIMRLIQSQLDVSFIRLLQSKSRG